MSEANPQSQQGEILLVDNGVPCFTIVISDEANIAVQEAVQELNYWVERITGTALPVTVESAWHRESHFIAVGSSSLTQTNGWEEEPFDQEEARVFILPDRIGLVGNDDESPYPGVQWYGTYYAVLEFVRRALEVRWIWPGPLGELFTRRPTLSVQTGSWKWIPELKLMRDIRNLNKMGLEITIARAESDFGFLTRKPAARDASATLADEQDRWLKRQRMNKSTDLRFAHAFGDWWSLYGEKHPDWFARPPAGVDQAGGRDVKLNTSNPAVAEQIIANWQERRQQDPARHRVLPVSPNDGRGFDTRPETRAWDHPSLRVYSDEEIYNGSEPILTDRYVKFWNIIARRVADIDSEALVTSFAYRNYRHPPLGPERVEPNIVIAYVGGEGYYPSERYIQQEWQGWFERGATLVWRPNLLHTGHGTPYLYARQLHEDFRFFHGRGMQGTSFDSMTGNWACQGLVYYVLAEQHVRPEASYDELAGEYFAAFGPAAEAVREYHEYFEEQTKRVPALVKKLAPSETWGGWWIAHIRCIPAFLTPPVLKHAESVLQRAEQAVASGDETERARVRVLRLGFDHARLMAEAFGKLGLHEPNGRVTFGDEEAKGFLQPLWNFRLQASECYLLPILRYILEEQRLLGLWTAFLTPEAASKYAERAATHILAGKWSYRLDPYDQGICEEWYRPESASSLWTADLPRSTPKSAAAVLWQRCIFRAPVLPDTGARFMLEFSAQVPVSHVWLNGRLVFESSRLASTYESDTLIDVSRLILDGAENVLVLRSMPAHGDGAESPPARVRYSPT